MIEEYVFVVVDDEDRLISDAFSERLRAEQAITGLKYRDEALATVATIKKVRLRD